MNYYLVRGIVKISRYMAGQDEESEFYHLVVAENSQQAGEKFKAYYEAKTSEYSVYYSVSDYEVMETIL